MVHRIGQGSVTELPASLVEGAVGFGADYAVDPQPPGLLEGADRLFDGRVVPGRVQPRARRKQAQPGELVADLGDDGSVVASAADLHPRMVAARTGRETGRGG
jgi:hypothetical protein